LLCRRQFTTNARARETKNSDQSAASCGYAFSQAPTTGKLRQHHLDGKRVHRDLKPEKITLVEKWL
jgi:hypothetical protein